MPSGCSRALISVSDKRGIADFARGLVELGVELVSTGGTATALREAGLEVRPIDDLTGFPEIMDGRVKTLNPRLYAGLLALRDNEEHMAQAAEHEIEFVDLVCVNLYPFESTVARAGVDDAEAIENIDIGGPTMIRAAAKNFAFAAIVTSPESYDAVLDELRLAGGTLSLPTRESLAAEAFSYTARYDTAIARWFAERRDDFPDLFVRAYEKAMDLPYGENPHQRAAFYTQVGARRGVLSRVRQLHGKQLSFNNVLDLDGARAVSTELGDDRAVVRDRQAQQPLRRGARRRPAGGLPARRSPATRSARSAASSCSTARSTSRPRRRSASSSSRCCSRPAYDEDALELLTAKPNVRILEDEERRRDPNRESDVRQVEGGLLVQDRDAVGRRAATQMEVVTDRQPTDQEWRDLLFAWRVCRHVKSNAIVIAHGRGDARHRRRPDEPRRQRQDRHRAARGSTAAPGSRSPPTRSSRSPTAPRRRWTAASAR